MINLINSFFYTLNLINLFQNVFKSKSFHEMSDAALSVVLKNDNLRVDERDVLNHVRDWATVNSVGTGTCYRAVCHLVFF